MRTTALRMTVAAASIAVIMGCASAVVRPPRDAFDLRVVQNDAASRFDVVLKSNDWQSICIAVEDWPDSSGRFTIENEGVSVQIGDRVLSSSSPLTSAYCPRGCGYHRIEPTKELHGFVAYEAFGRPAEISAALEKKLKFEVFPIYCPKE